MRDDLLQPLLQKSRFVGGRDTGRVLKCDLPRIQPKNLCLFTVYSQARPLRKITGHPLITSTLTRCLMSAGHLASQTGSKHLTIPGLQMNYGLKLGWETYKGIYGVVSTAPPTPPPPPMVWSPNRQPRARKNVNSHRDGGCPGRDPRNCPRF